MNIKYKLQKQHSIVKEWLKMKIIKTDQRNIILTKKLVGKKFKIYNGFRYFDLNVTQNMIGQKLGEFIPTRLKTTKRK